MNVAELPTILIGILIGILIAVCFTVIFAKFFLLCFNLIFFSYYNRRAIRHYSKAEELLKQYKISKDLSLGDEINFNLKKAEHYSRIADRFYNKIIKPSGSKKK